MELKTKGPSSRPSGQKPLSFTGSSAGGTEGRVKSPGVRDEAPEGHLNVLAVRGSQD